jgi:hypothetical protein
MRQEYTIKDSVPWSRWSHFRMAPSPTKRGPFHSQMSCSDLLLISPRSVSARRHSLQVELQELSHSVRLQKFNQVKN